MCHGRFLDPRPDWRMIVDAHSMFVSQNTVNLRHQFEILVVSATAASLMIPLLEELLHKFRIDRQRGILVATVPTIVRTKFSGGSLLRPFSLQVQLLIQGEVGRCWLLATIRSPMGGPKLLTGSNRNVTRPMQASSNMWKRRILYFPASQE
jgi:hypothetical protein